ncbi:MAG TPA: esterase [Balneola sp.]|jgi:NTE family protein|nr:esterase [Balneola sp.]MAO76663.1 esterase [Balneola sp.]MBF65070.1 esterase [Balneola sp.]HAW79739.1 esterase [Balneola sp.]HBZ37631.1 esterase [Balneola sp.]|tara:strand:+ start:1649 stop:2524 length:876 start_codon:yes stop_codon:yes gene_type:complete
MSEKKKVHLVLGSGGARGVAHIGVIEELEKEGYEIIEVIGCSMGAVVGGIYCAGQLPEYKKWMLSLTKKGVFDLLDFTFTSQGFVKGERLFGKHIEVTGQQKIEDFKIPFTAVATDMKHHKEVHFKEGDLFKALRASVSIPGIFTPIVDEEKVLVDGGVLNPLPINLVNKREDAIIVAVDINSKTIVEELLVKEEKKQRKRYWFESILPDSIKELTKSEEKKIESFSLFELMESTFSFTQDRLTELMIEHYKPDILVEVPRETCDTFEFYKSKQLVEIGARAFRNALVKFV